MKFSDVALGARFKYIGQENIWIKIGDERRGIVAEYDEEYIYHKNWSGQGIYSAAETNEELENLKVRVIG